MSYQIQPFSDTWQDEVQRLFDEMQGVRHKVEPFFWADPDPAEVTLVSKVAGEVAHYGLEQNDRHATISAAAAAAGNQVKRFAGLRKRTASVYLPTEGLVAQELDGIRLTAAINEITQFNAHLRNLADELSGMSAGGSREEISGYVQSIDLVTRKLAAQYTLSCGLAGQMIDIGNAFLDLDVQLRAALEFYAYGRAPKGWSERLPAPVQSIFSEGTWTLIEEILKAVAEHGLPAFGPFAALPVTGVRIFLTIKEKRTQTQRKFRRGDVDELLDLADQLTQATQGARTLQDSLSAITQAVSAVAGT